MPASAGGQSFASHHDRSGADGAVLADGGVGQHGRGRAEGCAGAQLGGADPHQPVVEQVSLDDAVAIDDASVAQLGNVKFGDGERLEPHVAPDGRALHAQVDGHDRGGGGRAEQPGSGELLLAGVDDLIAPDEE